MLHNVVKKLFKLGDAEIINLLNIQMGLSLSLQKLSRSATALKSFSRLMETL